MNKEDLVSISHDLILGDILVIFYFCEKMLGENANKIHYLYKAMVVLHICHRILGIPSSGYPGNENQISMLFRF